jgi:hypothetical protein
MNGHGQGVYLVVRTTFVIGRVIAFTVGARLGLAGTEPLVKYRGVRYFGISLHHYLVVRTTFVIGRVIAFTDGAAGA